MTNIKTDRSHLRENDLYRIFCIPRGISQRNDNFNNAGMRKLPNAVTRLLRDLTLAPPRKLRRSLFEGFLDDYYFLSRTYSHGRERTFFLNGKETYGTERARGWNMRCGQLIYLRGMPDIRFVELRFKSARSRRTGRYKQRRTTGRTCEREGNDVERERVARRPVNRLSLHRHESRGGPYWPLKKAAIQPLVGSDVSFGSTS